MNVQQRWHDLQNSVADLCERHGRPTHSVKIIGVTKYVGVAETLQLIDAGCVDLGESRPQQLWEKAGSINTPHIRWHMIGHLQRNKVVRTIPLIYALHSLDSTRLAEAVSDAAVAQQRSVDCFLEFNISGEEAKTGIRLEAAESIVEHIMQLGGIRISGLMGMASDTEDEANIKRQFTTLRQLRDSLRNRYETEQHSFAELSMGMSQDYHLAVECGATYIRVGSTLFR